MSHSDAQPAAAGEIVIDSNVALDWLLFGDPSTTLLARKLAAGELHWVATEAMQRELGSVLSRPIAQRSPAELSHALAAVLAYSHLVDPPPPAGPGAPRCADPSDQMFIDLALARGVRWLLTRDKALLKLARAARVRGTEVMRPLEWAALVRAWPHSPAP